MEAACKEANVLTPQQKSRSERNRQKALLLKQARLAKHPYIQQQQNQGSVSGNIVNTGGGFLLEDDCGNNEPVLPYEIPTLVGSFVCLECGKKFSESFLNTRFDFSVCDSCRDKDEKHKLITKTDAKSDYLLKDADLEKREPPLRYILKKNPHANRGDMRLYLKCQVEERSLDVWGSAEELERAIEQKKQEHEKRKEKAFDKKVQALRKQVRSSLYRKETHSHEHEYGDERYDEVSGAYHQTCKTCGQIITFEKM